MLATALAHLCYPKVELGLREAMHLIHAGLVMHGMLKVIEAPIR